MSAWRPAKRNGFWYCVRDAFRVPDALLCKSESEAAATADALNMIASDRYVTVALTKATNMLYVPRSDGT
jgi:hypothetical protein